MIADHGEERHVESRENVVRPLVLVKQAAIGHVSEDQDELDVVSRVDALDGPREIVVLVVIVPDRDEFEGNRRGSAGS